jgi:transposase
VRGKRGRPRRRPRRLFGDGAHRSRRHRQQLRAGGISVQISRPKQPKGSGLGTQRWVVERTISWLHQYRHLRVRYERRADIHEAFLKIAGCLICLSSSTPRSHFDRRSKRTRGRRPALPLQELARSQRMTTPTREHT